MASRDFTVAIVAGLLAGVPFVVAALDEMADEGPDGPYSNDAYGALLDWSALVLLVPLPFLLARYATLPVQAGLVAGAIASVGAFLFIFTVGRIDGAAEFAITPLVVFPPVGFGALAGTRCLPAASQCRVGPQPPAPRRCWAS